MAKLPAFKFYGEVTPECRVRLYNAPRYQQALKMFAGRKVVWQISDSDEIRTLKQNAYYHVYLQIIAMENGKDEEVDELWYHERFKKAFLKDQVIQKEIYGEIVTMEPTTTTLSKTTFNEYLAKIEKLTGIPLPDRGLFYGEDDQKPPGNEAAIGSAYKK